MKKTQETELSNAPVTATPAMPPMRQRTVERQGSRSEPYTRRLPQVRGGTCEYCGVLDPLVPSQFQYRLCPHFRGVGELRCSYCDDAKDTTDVINHAILNVAEHPNNPDQLVVWCNSYECSAKHEARFRVNR